MKKVLSLAIACTLLLAFAGCSPSSETEIPSDAEEPSGSETEIPSDPGADNPPETEEPSDAETLTYTVEEKYCTRGELNIYGKLYIPEGEGEKPAVILSHSSSLTHASMQSYCKEFASRGYVAYAFDFCGGSADSQSDGDTLDMTVFTEVEDLEAVLTEISALSFVDETQVYLFGTSQGGLVSALVANDHPESVKGMMLLYPAFNIPDLIRKQYASKDDIPETLSSFGGAPSGRAFAETLYDFDPYAHIAAYTGNVIILHGSSDFIVDPEYSERAAEVYASCELHIIEGANHGFNSENLSMSGSSGSMGNWGDMMGSMGNWGDLMGSMGNWGDLMGSMGDWGSFMKNYDPEVWVFLDAYLAKNK